MSKWTIALFIISFASEQLLAQACNTHAFLAHTQQELNTFSELHGNCAEFEGNIYISGADITDLDPILHLKEIGGALTIMNTTVREVNFSNLERLGGGFFCTDNRLLRKIDGLNKLTSIFGSFEIKGNLLLEEISGFNSLESIAGFMELSSNSSLVSISGFEQLDSVGFWLHFYQNNLLTELTGFNALHHIGMDLYISFNLSLQTINAFNNLMVLGRNLWIEDNPELTSLLGFERIQQIENELVVERNPKLFHFDTFKELTKLNYLHLSDNATLAQIALFSKLERVDSTVYLAEIPLTDLNFLKSLKEVHETLFIGVMPDLTNLHGLEGLESAKQLTLYNNPVLSSTLGLSNLMNIKQLSISKNPDFNSLDDLLQVNTDSLEMVTIRDNQNFNDHTSPFFCKLMTEAPTKLTLYNNGPLCSHIIDIANGCHVSIGCNAINVLINTQPDVTAFLEKNQGCTELNNLRVGGGVMNMTGMESIHTIHGILELSTNTQADMSVLENIVWVGGDLIVSGWGASSDFEELKNLGHVGGDFILNQNGTVTSFEGFQSLDSIIGNMIIYNSMVMEEFGEWPVLELVGGLEIRGNGHLLKTDGFSQLKNITGDFKLSGNSKLKILSGFTSLERIGGSFEFSNSSIHTFEPLPELVEVGNNFYLSAKVMKQIGPLPKLSRIGGDFLLQSTDSLRPADFFPELTQLGGNIIVTNTRDLNSLSFFSHLTYMGGGLSAYSNSGLRKIDAFNLLDSIQFIRIDQYNMKELNAFNTIRVIEEDFTAFFDLDTFEMPFLKEIGTNMSLRGDIKVMSFPLLEVIGLDLEWNNSDITDMACLSNLKKIGGKFELKNSTSLTSLGEISENLQIDGPISLTNNSKLEWCASKPICNALQFKERPHEISFNAEGCESIQTVDDHCLLLDTHEEAFAESEISVFPVPASNTVSVNFKKSISNSGSFDLKIFDIYGRMVLSQEHNGASDKIKIDITSLMKGMYILSIFDENNRNIHCKKIIIQK